MLVGLGLGATASTAAVDTGHEVGQSGVTVGTYSDHNPFSDIVPGDYPCFDGVAGTINGSEDVFGHYNNSPRFFHFEGFFSGSYRIDFLDGRYVIGSWVSHNENGFGSSGTDGYSVTEPGQEHATVYSADGQPIGSVTIHTLLHVTARDRNRDSQIDPSEIVSSVDSFRLTCG
jgi:hypothetical protein